MVAKFVRYCNESKPELFKIIQQLSAAYLIASTVVSQIKEEDSKKTCEYNSMIIYLDTPIVLKILGLNTDEMQISYAELLNELKNRNNIFRVFQHTYDEINGILSDCEHWIGNPKYEAKYASQALRTFVARKYNKGDIQLFITSLRRRLEKYNIQVDDTDYYSEKFNYLQIDESFVRDAIIKSYSESNAYFNIYNKKYTIECDVKSISAIFKLRKKKVYKDYCAAKYIFITTNSTLAYISSKFTASQNPSYSNRVYPCTTDVVIGTAMWLSAPVKKIDGFSEKKLLADCSSIVLPSEKLISELSDSIERLKDNEVISSSDYYLLKTYQYSESSLSNKTLNNEELFNDKITEEILADIKLEIESPLLVRIKAKDEQLEKAKQENQQLLKIIDEENQCKVEAGIIAEKKLKNITKILIPIALASLLLILAIISNFVKMQLLYKNMLIVLSSLIAFIDVAFIIVISNNIFKLREIWKKRIIKKRLYKEYSKKWEMEL